MRGRKTKPSFLKLVEGNRGRRPIVPDPVLDPNFDNEIPVPPSLRKRREREVWDQVIRKLPWLGALDIPVAFIWTRLFCEFERNPEMTAARVSQLRGLSASLGLDPSSRSRLSADLAERPNANDTAAAKYFGG